MEETEVFRMRKVELLGTYVPEVSGFTVGLLGRQVSATVNGHTGSYEQLLEVRSWPYTPGETGESLSVPSETTIGSSEAMYQFVERTAHEFLLRRGVL